MGLVLSLIHICGGWRLGGAVGYSNSRSRTGDRASSSEADSYSLTVYGGKAFDAGSAKLNLSLGASYTWHDMKTQRYADAAGLPQTLKADYDGNTTQVFGELGYAMPLTDRLTLEPFVGAGFSSLRTHAFTESGGDAALRGDAGRNNVTTTTLGLHARSAFESAGAQGQLFGTLGWRHAFGDVDPASTMAFVQGGESFTTNGVPIARDAALVELGVNMAVSKRTTVGVIYGTVRRGQSTALGHAGCALSLLIADIDPRLAARRDPARHLDLPGAAGSGRLHHCEGRCGRDTDAGVDVQRARE